uniref:Uncharacterized protein n=1 Tax=Pyrodinium bahamense TaxID=73915 RepID=A0A7S0BA98_9DINO
MERIMSYMWDKQKGKFDLSRLRSHCPWLTADDCLYSFSPYPPHRGPIMDAHATYQAAPPLFTSFARHGSVQTEEKGWVQASFCDDISSALDYSARACEVF